MIQPQEEMSLETAKLLLSESNHRCANDLQLVVSLLALQSRRATHPEAKQLLADTKERVAVLARARSASLHNEHLSLKASLGPTCQALYAQAEPRGIRVVITLANRPERLSAGKITIVALIVNELATNAIKHAFAEAEPGRITITAEHDHEYLLVIVDDDGLPFPDKIDQRDGGLGLRLVDRLVASMGGSVTRPEKGNKIFQICVPAP
jgi:two-component sensor histidine kinase